MTLLESNIRSVTGEVCRTLTTVKKVKPAVFIDCTRYVHSCSPGTSTDAHWLQGQRLSFIEAAVPFCLLWIQRIDLLFQRLCSVLLEDWPWACCCFTGGWTPVSFTRLRKGWRQLWVNTWRWVAMSLCLLIKTHQWSIQWNLVLVSLCDISELHQFKGKRRKQQAVLLNQRSTKSS